MMNSSNVSTLQISHDSKSINLEIERLFNPICLLLKPPNDPPKKSQLQDLQETKEELEKELDEAKTALSGLCEDVSRLKGEYEILKKKNEDLTNHEQLISRKKAEFEEQYKFLANAKCSTRDKELVETTKFQYKCLRNSMQVRFSYKVYDDILEGYVFNKVTNKIFSFSFNTSHMNNDEVEERLMKLMKDAIHPSYAEVSSGE